jgi:hypothetical protein
MQTYIYIYIYTYIHTNIYSHTYWDAGGFPHCVDAQKLSNMIQPCSNTYDLEVWKFTEKTRNEETGQMEYVAPDVIPKAEPKPRFVTPQNRMVGAFVLTQVCMHGVHI